MILQESLRNIELATSISVLPDDHQHMQRLREIEFAPGERAKSLAKTRKSKDLNAIEIEVLNSFPQFGIELSDEHNTLPPRMISQAITFSRHMQMPLPRARAVIQLLRLRKLLICTGVDPSTREHREFIVKAAN